MYFIFLRNSKLIGLPINKETKSKEKNEKKEAQILTQEAEAQIKIAGQICAILMIHQVAKLENVYNVLLTNNPRTINKPLFDKIIEILKQSTAITSIKNGYIYQTLSIMEATLKTRMPSGEIVEEPLGVTKTWNEIAEFIKN